MATPDPKNDLCAQCGATEGDVRYVTPDMDITPVPLCLICRVTLFYAPGSDMGPAAEWAAECEEFGCAEPDHSSRTVAPEEGA